MKNLKMSCLFVLFAIFLAHQAFTAQAQEAVDIEKLQKLELGEVFDVSIKIRQGMITWDNLESYHGFTTGYHPQKPNQVISTKIVNLTNHMGTHIDAPGHVDENLLNTGGTVDFVDLTTLNGPALVLQVPDGKNLTAEVLQAMNIPKGVKRVLFRTDNSDKDILGKGEFMSNYTGFTLDGAQWLVQNTDIKLVGADYLSAAVRENVYLTHKALLDPKDKIVPVECLDLRKITPGWYMINCLPLNVEGLEGSPTRCILSKINMELLKC